MQAHAFSRVMYTASSWLTALPPACRCFPGWYKAVHRYLFTLLLLRPVEKIRCPMVTVSDLIEQYNIK